MIKGWLFLVPLKLSNSFFNNSSTALLRLKGNWAGFEIPSFSSK
jgi:hypothetical protein